MRPVPCVPLTPASTLAACRLDKSRCWRSNPEACSSIGLPFPLRIFSAMALFPFGLPASQRLPDRAPGHLHIGMLAQPNPDVLRAAPALRQRFDLIPIQVEPRKPFAAPASPRLFNFFQVIKQNFIHSVNSDPIAGKRPRARSAWRDGRRRSRPGRAEAARRGPAARTDSRKPLPQPVSPNCCANRPPASTGPAPMLRKASLTEHGGRLRQPTLEQPGRPLAQPGKRPAQGRVVRERRRRRKRKPLAGR